MSVLLVLSVSCSDKEAEEAVEASNQNGAEASEQVAGADGEKKMEMDDTSWIIQAVLDHPDFATHISEDQAPVKIAGKSVAKVMAKKFEQPVKVLKSKEAKGSKDTIIWVKKVKIKGKKAAVFLTLKPSGVKGKFSLAKDDKGMWMVKKASLSKGKKWKKGKKGKKKMKPKAK